MRRNFPKAAFFDIDGTLVPYDTRCISQADLDAIESLRGQGTLIFIVTGRNISDIDNIPFPLDGAVCCNGALTYIVKDGQFTLVEDHPIPRRKAIEIARIIDRNRIPAGASTSRGTLFVHRTQKALEFIRRVNMPSPEEGDILEAADKARIYSFCPFVSSEEEKILFKDALSGLGTSRWCEDFCDISIQGLDKVLGIERILGAYGIKPADIVAFGDGINDIRMLKFAGCGVAMGTAEDEIKAAADFVTAAANENGVSRFLEKTYFISASQTSGSWISEE